MASKPPGKPVPMPPPPGKCPTCGLTPDQRELRAYQRQQWQQGTPIPYPVPCKACEGR